MITKNKYKIMVLVSCLVPMTITSNFIPDSPKTKIVETVKLNQRIIEKSKIITFKDDFAQENQKDFWSESPKRETNNAQTYFIITISVLIGAFFSLIGLLVAIKIKLKKIKNQEQE